jgi:hypothetical protein
MSYGSGTGNSFQSDYAKCERFFFHKHRQGLRAKTTGEAVALAVGTALHAYLEQFYLAEMRGEPFTQCVNAGVEKFHEIIRATKLTDSLANAELEERAMTALSLLSIKSDEFWRRLNEGDERTIACELHLTLQLPETFEFEGRILTIRPELRSYTVQIDRLYDQLRHEEWDGPVRVVEDYKSTSSSSPANYIEQCLMNDQSTGYVHTVNRAIEHHPEGAAGFMPDGYAPKLEVAEPVGAVRYSGFRVKGRVDTSAAFAEDITGIDQAKCNDWYKRLLLVRARMSGQWDLPRDMWVASRIAFGPCTQFYRQCEFWNICDAPGDESRVIETEYESTPEAERVPA